MAGRMRLALAAGLMMLVASCTATYRNNGYVPPDADLAELTVGVDTRDTVAAAVGRPSSAGLLEASAWYYVQSRFKNFAYRAPEEISREVVAVSFDPRGTIENIERFGLEEGRVVILSRRVTDSNVKGVGFLAQLLGNIGNLDASNFLN